LGVGGIETAKQRKKQSAIKAEKENMEPASE
jgi:hypothetical protein